MAINVLEVIRQGQVGGGESHLLDLIAVFDNRVNPIVLSFTGGQMIDALTQIAVSYTQLDVYKRQHITI